MNTKLNTVKLQSGAGKGDRAPYHHGDLREALIKAGEEVLAERGVEGFSLREAARRAGVSAAAPAHHFKDTKGLLTAIAARGFDALVTAMGEGQEDCLDDKARRRAQARAYIKFAREHPAHFKLMWRKSLLNNDDPHLQLAANTSFARLLSVVPGGTHEAVQDKTSASATNAVAAWAMVHGYAHLMLDGPLANAPLEFFEQVLDRLVLPGA